MLIYVFISYEDNINNKPSDVILDGSMDIFMVEGKHLFPYVD